jgi:hypothetical protein
MCRRNGKKLDFIDSARFSRQYEFVVLCEARDARAQHHNTMESDEGWRYCVMLVTLNVMDSIMKGSLSDQ